MNHKEIVQFGKYKDKSIHDLLSDKSYCEWLVAQPWFKQKYETLFLAIKGDIALTIEETPEHNRIQIKFMDEAWCNSFIKAIFTPPSYEQSLNNLNEIISRSSHLISTDYIRHAEYTIKYHKGKPHTRISNILFEVKGIDVLFDWEIGLVLDQWTEEELGRDGEIYSQIIKLHNGIRGHARIEIKPTIGDDYPAILRQMRANHSNILLYDHLTSSTLSKDGLNKYFEMNNIKVLDINDIYLDNEPMLYFNS